MRPSSFDYDAPRTSAEAAELLAEHPGAVVIAGGQTLVPQMIRREIEPPRLVDINRVEELETLMVETGRAQLGALVRHAQVERSAELRARWPLLAEACGYVSNPVVRRKGTVGGSLAWQTGRSEVVAALLAYDAEFAVRSRAAGTRHVTVAEALERPGGRVASDELIVVVLLAAGPDHAYGFAEFSTRRWDPARAGAACRIDLEANGDHGTRIVVFGEVERPHRLERVETRVAEGAAPEDAGADAAREVEPLLANRPAAVREHLAALFGDSTARAVQQARVGSGGKRGA